MLRIHPLSVVALFVTTFSVAWGTPIKRSPIESLKQNIQQTWVPIPRDFADRLNAPDAKLTEQEQMRVMVLNVVKQRLQAADLILSRLAATEKAIENAEVRASVVKENVPATVAVKAPVQEIAAVAVKMMLESEEDNLPDIKGVSVSFSVNNQALTVIFVDDATKKFVHKMSVSLEAGKSGQIEKLSVKHEAL